jgi:hypothetical protein
MKIAACVLTAFVAISASGQQAAPVKDFQKRVDEYMKVRKTASAQIPKLAKKAEPEQIAANERAQADAIREARANAAHGDIFTPAASAYFRSVIREYMAGDRPAKETAKQGNPAEEGAAKVTLKVNAKYPDNAPLSTVPPGLLLKLPELPKEIDYRFVGRHLVLHDAQAGIIIDFLPNAMP